MLTGRSGYRDGKLECIAIRQDGSQWCELHVKLAHTEAVQQVEEQWRSRVLEWNGLAAQ